MNFICGPGGADRYRLFTHAPTGFRYKQAVL